ncbi:K(+)-transporting ATPase subunit C [Oscillatoria sp. CS-180]|uniref:K(+)-transporting ATPase subunit C n=1 Tax=Oscillatoria sp. CS-180 TaxID=3021720 RepID=UPI0023300D7E|nr:K(+)-transporting ATPase subunit C [Oscillatoria sp. CS-180]MDB9525084.1 K(+)-transporting ATPase subunit C [Oscillatoria sp. CS-180]
MFKELLIGIRSTVTLWLLAAIIYPAFFLIVGQVIFPNQANGSLLTTTQGEIVGSALIGQTFTSAEYFRSRPSAVAYSEGEEAQPTGTSGASNLAPSNPDLMTRIGETATELEQAGITPTADLLYASGSGLDPHISPAAAAAQIATVADARGLDAATLEQLVAEHTEGRFLGLFGEPGVNTTTLNLAVDNLAAS